MKATDSKESNISSNFYLVRLKINNDTESSLKPKGSWFDSGGFLKADEFVTIKARDHDKLYFIQNNGFAGCSGYVHYNHSMMGEVVIAFSNPVWGRCKVNVGVLKESDDPKSVWDNMNDWIESKKTIQIDDYFHYDMVNTTGDVNDSVVNFYDY